jgi:serine/threonine-protein kinase
LEIRPTADTEAYTLYLKGKHYWNERSDEGMRKAIAYFERAIEKDGKFALGYSGLADCYSVMARNSQAEVAPRYQRAKEFVMKAMELDESLAEVHATLGSILHYYDHNWNEAEAEFRKALEIKPNYSTAHQWYAHMLSHQRRFTEADREISTALRLDPFSPVINMNAGGMYYYQGENDKAIAQFEKTKELDPTFIGVYQTSGIIQTLVSMRLYERAMREVDAFGRVHRRPREVELWRAYVLAAMRKNAEARKLLVEIEPDYRMEYISPYVIALIHFLMEDNDAGFQWLQTAYEAHDPNLNLSAIDLYRLRNDSRYVEMLTKIGLGNLSHD